MNTNILVPAVMTLALAISLRHPANGQSKPTAKNEDSSPAIATTSAQAEAVRKYPARGQTGSAFNLEFVSRVKRYQREAPDIFKDPAWPMKLAAEVAQAIEKPAAANAQPVPSEKGPGPWNDPADPSLWPNQTSRANGDAWLVQNHDRIRQMQPRLPGSLTGAKICPDSITGRRTRAASR